MFLRLSFLVSCDKSCLFSPLSLFLSTINITASDQPIFGPMSCTLLVKARDNECHSYSHHNKLAKTTQGKTMELRGDYNRGVPL